MTFQGSAGVPKGREAVAPLPAAPAGAQPPRAAVPSGSPSPAGNRGWDPHRTNALIQDHRRIAYAIAREFHLPGSDRDDVDQEALIALWLAAAAHNPARGPFAPFARLVIRRRLTTALKLANREKHKPLTLAVRHTLNDEGEPSGIADLLGSDVTDPHRIAVGRETLAAVCAAHATLTDLEREALRRSLNGIPYSHDKQLDNAQHRAVSKLRKAAA